MLKQTVKYAKSVLRDQFKNKKRMSLEEFVHCFPEAAGVSGWVLTSDGRLSLCRGPGGKKKFKEVIRLDLRDLSSVMSKESIMALSEKFTPFVDGEYHQNRFLKSVGQDE